jgi:hypothetical protein
MGSSGDALTGQEQFLAGFFGPDYSDNSVWAESDRALEELIRRESAKTRSKNRRRRMPSDGDSR